MNSLSLLLTLTSILISDAFKWHDCGDSNSTIHWNDIKVPEPLNLKDMRLGAKWTIDKEVPPGSQSKLEIWRIFRVLLLPLHYKIPCVNEFGSCNYDICRKSDIDNFCLFQEYTANTTCGCPMSPKIVEGYDYRLKTPNLSLNAYQTIFANGLFKVRWTWFDPNWNKIGCVEVEFNLTT